MIEIFRRNLFVNSILLLPYIFILRLNTLINPVSFALGDDSNVFQKIIFLNITNPLLQNVLANLLIFGQALLINHIFIKNRLTKQITLFPGLFYIIFVSVISENAFFSPILVANTFIILAVMNVFETYKMPLATSFIFNTGFLLAFASLFYSLYFAFILFGLVALIQLRSFKPIEKIQFFIGFFVPYFLLFTYRYWNNISFMDLDFIKDIFFRWPLFRSDSLLVFYLSVSILLASVILSLAMYGNLTAKKNIQAQKKIDCIFWILFFCLLSFLIFNSDGLIHLISLAFPLSILIGCLVSDSKYKILHELIHILIISLIFINQFKLVSF